MKNDILSMSNDKSPRSDGLPIEFYKTFSYWVSKDLLQVYVEALDKGSLGKIMNKGIINLLPKCGDKNLIKNWR